MAVTSLRAGPSYGLPGQAPEQRDWVKIQPAKSSKLGQDSTGVDTGNHIKLFNGVLKRSGLKSDRDGNARTAYSLRHSYIRMRLMEGADIYQIAKNCRTSVEMIERFYAAHIKTTLDAAAINVRKPKPPRRKAKDDAARDDANGRDNQ